MKSALLAAILWSTAAAFAAVDVNTATEAELDGIKGLGPGSTARILQARAQGPFQDWADLMRRVKGIKPSKAQQLSRDGLTVGNTPYPAMPAAQ